MAGWWPARTCNPYSHSIHSLHPWMGAFFSGVTCRMTSIRHFARDAFHICDNRISIWAPCSSCPQNCLVCCCLSFISDWRPAWNSSTTMEWRTVVRMRRNCRTRPNPAPLNCCCVRMVMRPSCPHCRFACVPVCSRRPFPCSRRLRQRRLRLWVDPRLVGAELHSGPAGPSLPPAAE